MQLPPSLWVTVPPIFAFAMSLWKTMIGTNVGGAICPFEICLVFYCAIRLAYHGQPATLQQHARSTVVSILESRKANPANVPTVEDTIRTFYSAI